MNHKPFNLEEALAGKPVITRDGRAVTELHQLPTITTKGNVIAVVAGAPKHFYTDGSYLNNGTEHRHDLFMKPEQKSFWTNIYHNDEVHTHATKEEADRCADNGRIACIETIYYI